MRIAALLAVLVVIAAAQKPTPTKTYQLQTVIDGSCISAVDWSKAVCKVTEKTGSCTGLRIHYSSECARSEVVEVGAARLTN